MAVPFRRVSRVRIEKLIKFQQTFWKILLKTVLNLQSLDLAGVELLQPFLCDRCQLLSFAGLMIQVFMGSSQHQLDPVQLVYLEIGRASCRERVSVLV